MILKQKKLPQRSRKFVCPLQGARHSLTAHLGSRSNPAARNRSRSDEHRQEVNPMRLTHLNEGPSAFAAVCAQVHASRVGYSVVLGVPSYRWSLAGQLVAFTRQSKQGKCVVGGDGGVGWGGGNGL